jgi:multidrug efflux pump subunit AcrB
VTYHIEDAIQQMEQVKELKMSISREGMSEITVKFKDKYKAPDFPNIYDELRRKINDVQSQLPPGAGPSIVVDDFADVYGIFGAIYGEGYSYRDLKDVADLLKEQLVLVDGVRKVVIDGVRKEVVYLEISRARLAELGLGVGNVKNVLESQNVVSDAGRVRVGDEYLRIEPTGQFQSVREIADVLISSQAGRLIYLGDIATITRAYEEIPNELHYYNGQPALTLGISMAAGENVVAVGRRIAERIEELRELIPLGMEMAAIYNQPVIVDEAVSGFVLSVQQALGIVVVVLLAFMGLKVGLIIGAVLLITVAGTLWIMGLYGIELQRISLGALIIALGMLVDNAIVVAEGMLIRIRGGMNAMKAAGEVVSSTMWPLLGGTVVGILAFSGIGLSTDSTGEFANSLFWVILISLSLSWVTAVSTTPLLCALLLKPAKDTDGEAADAYGGVVFRAYRGLLAGAIRARVVTVAGILGLFALAVWGFQFVNQAFFPSSNTPMFFVDLWEVEGTDIRKTRDDLLQVSEFVRAQEGVQFTAGFVGAGAQRFTLVYSPESPSSAYAQLIVVTDTRDRMQQIIHDVTAFMAAELPHTEPKTKLLRIGPGRDAKIEARFSGPDPAVLRELSRQAQAIFHADPESKDVRDDWRQPVKLIRPIFNEQAARPLGISRVDVAKALAVGFEGEPIGVYRDGRRLLPIIARAPEAERSDVRTIEDLVVYSPALERTVPIKQVVSGFETVFEDAIERAFDRQLSVVASTNPKGELATPLFERVRPKVEAIELPPGYTLTWAGEYEDQNNAQGSLARSLPGSFLLMIVTVILLFGKIRQPLIIWLTVPLAVIGITAGLLLMNGAFDFMSLLGALSLIGLLIKNAIVLIEEIDQNIDAGVPPERAILDSSVARMRPVMMAASTTILGLIPLLPDVFFVNMALTMMFGLGFATVLTLIFVPTLYSIFFRVPASAVKA